MITTLNKLRRQVEVSADKQADTHGKSGRRLNPSALPSTQDAIAVVAAQDDVLILRSHVVVAAVGFGSVNDTLLADEAVAARLGGYRDAL